MERSANAGVPIFAEPWPARGEQVSLRGSCGFLLDRLHERRSKSAMNRPFLRVLSLALLAVACSVCSAYDAALLDNTPLRNLGGQNKRLKVVVLPFGLRGAKWGGEFADAVALQLLKTGKFEVVERSALEQILKEQRITKSGLFDAATGARIGKLLGARFLLIGQGNALTQGRSGGRETSGNLVDTFTLKVVDVETASNYIIVRKRPGASWDWGYRAMYCLGLSLIWSREDVLLQSSEYDRVAVDLVDEMQGPLIKRIPLPIPEFGPKKEEP